MRKCLTSPVSKETQIKKVGCHVLCRKLAKKKYENQKIKNKIIKLICRTIVKYISNILKHPNNVAQSL